MDGCKAVGECIVGLLVRWLFSLVCRFDCEDSIRVQKKTVKCQYSGDCGRCDFMSRVTEVVAWLFGGNIKFPAGASAEVRKMLFQISAKYDNVGFVLGPRKEMVIFSLF